MTSRFPAAFVAVSLCALPALAFSQQERSEQDNTQSTSNELDPVVVTPTLTSVTAEASLASVTVIDEQQLREQQRVDMMTVLRGQPGVDTTGNGSYGKASSVFMRGTSSDSTLLLVDGVRLRSATAGSPAWQYLPPQMMGRVEIVRGPRGSLYGADAVGGVVQMFTRDQGSWLNFAGGNFGTLNAGAGTAGSAGNTDYSLGINRFRTDGTELRENSEERGYDNDAAIASLEHHFAERASLGLFGFHTQGETEFEGITPQEDRHMDYALEVAGLKGDAWLTDGWQVKAVVSQAKDESEDFQNDSSNGKFNTRTRTANLQNVLLAGEHQFILGGEYQRDVVNSDTLYDAGDRDNKAGFGQALLNFGPLDVQASLRHDDNDAFGSETTGGAALGYKPDGHHRVRASYGTAFKAPTFNDLYYPGFSNPNLEAETSATTELGVRGQYNVWYWDAALYRTDIEDLITFDSMLWIPTNVDEARIEGAELALGLDWQQWRAQLAFSALKPEDQNTGNILARRAQRIGRLDVDRQLGRFSLGGTASFQGHRYNDAASQQRLPGFGVLDLRAGWQISEQWSTRLSVDNVLDKEYATAQNFMGWNYLNAGRSFLLSLSYDTP